MTRAYRGIPHLLLITTFFAYGDGGTLRFTTPTNVLTDPSPWPIEDSILPTETQVELKERNKSGYLLERDCYGEKTLLFGTDSGLIVYSDVNRDGRFQENEGNQPQKQNTLPSTVNLFTIPIPVKIGKIIQPVYAQINYTVRRDYAFFIIQKILNQYTGELQIDGVSYPACIVFRSLFPNDYTVNEIVLVDTNRDGTFHHFDDAWFSAQGIAYFNHSLWTVKTDFNEDKAAVSMRPYSGPCGQLKIEGQNFYRLYLQGELRESNSGNAPFFCRLCVPKNSDSIFTLPVGPFLSIKTWLISGLPKEEFLQSQNMRVALDIYKGEETSLPLGGPFKLRGEIDTSYIFGLAYLNYGGIDNYAGHPYEFIGLEEIRWGGNPSPPSWEIHNSKGKTVAAGQWKLTYG